MLVNLGDWDAAEAELTRAVDSDGLGDLEVVADQQGWLAALRGDADTAETMLGALGNWRASDNPEEQGSVCALQAFTAVARRQPEAALRYARAALTHWARADVRIDVWPWSLAARAAQDLGDAGAVGELLDLLDSHPPGQVGPVLRAERDLARARLTGRRR